MERMIMNKEHPLWDAETMKERLFSQESRLISAANRLANVIHATPHDPAFPNVEPRALIVGGFVRDAMLGGHPKDIDLEVYGISPDRLESLLNQLYPGLVNTVGRSFGILKIHLGDDVEFDVSIPRRESKSGRGHKGFAIEGDPGMSIREAAKRRDFTINALAADPLTGEVIDEFGGLEDLQSRTLRVTDPERFQDDPLRIWRAVQFAARLDFTVEPQSRALLRSMVERGDLEELAPERITEELKKLLLKAERPSVGIELARDLGIVEKYYPELHVLEGTPQEPEWHPEGDVWIHTMIVTDCAAKIIRDPSRGFTEEERLMVMLGALCHDLGKPETTAVDNGRIRSHGHSEAGEAHAKSFLKKFSFSDAVARAVFAITREHLAPSMLARAIDQGKMTEDGYANAVRKMLKRLHPISWRVLIAASEADSRGRAILGVDTGPYAAGDRLSAVISERELDREPVKPLIQGRDLIAFGITPGPRMGKIISHIEQLRDEGKISDRESALRAARDMISHLS